jgi:cellulose synthase/poly-beta-1,6-N-acetylglucosamine synthase-like glycosyltransferase
MKYLDLLAFSWPIFIWLLAMLQSKQNSGYSKIVAPVFPKSPTTGNALKLSVVVVARNEEDGLPQLLADFEIAANLAGNRAIEFLLADDQSSDRTRALLDTFSSGQPAAKIYSWPDSSGKPDCLRRMIPECKGDTIIFCDADCTINSGWFQVYVHGLPNEMDIVSAPVLLSENIPDDTSGLHHYWQRIQWLVLSGSASLLSSLGKPLSAFGANMAVRRSKLEELGGYSSMVKVNSGEDIALFNAMRIRGAGTAFLCGQSELIVRTAYEIPSSSLRQLSRWLSSLKHLPLYGMAILTWAVSAHLALIPLFSTDPLGCILWLLITAAAWWRLLFVYAEAVCDEKPIPVAILAHYILSPLYVIQAVLLRIRGKLDWRNQ